MPPKSIKSVLKLSDEEYFKLFQKSVSILIYNLSICITEMYPFLHPFNAHGAIMVSMVADGSTYQHERERKNLV